MMKKKLLFTSITLFVALGVITSCSKKDNNDDDNGDKQQAETITITIDASAFSDWKYFSFETGKEVPAAEVGDYGQSKEKANWDIAIHRGDIRTNSGKSGVGAGGALKASGTTLNEVTFIPTTGYTTDEDAEISIVMGEDPVIQSKNHVLEDWYSREGMPPVYTVNDYVYIVKTAKGKYAKVKFSDYTNDAGLGGHVKFSYQYPVE